MLPVVVFQHDTIQIKCMFLKADGAPIRPEVESVIMPHEDTKSKTEVRHRSKFIGMFPLVAFPQSL